MITKTQSITVREFHHYMQRNADGSPMRARRNGATKEWKREPERFQIPVKQGLKNHGYITDADAYAWFDNAKDALEYGAQCERERLDAIAQRKAQLEYNDMDSRR